MLGCRDLLLTALQASLLHAYPRPPNSLPKDDRIRLKHEFRLETEQNRSTTVLTSTQQLASANAVSSASSLTVLLTPSLSSSQASSASSQTNNGAASSSSISSGISSVSSVAGPFAQSIFYPSPSSSVAPSSSTPLSVHPALARPSSSSEGTMTATTSIITTVTTTTVGAPTSVSHTSSSKSSSSASSPTSATSSTSISSKSSSSSISSVQAGSLSSSTSASSSVTSLKISSQSSSSASVAVPSSSHTSHTTQAQQSSASSQQSTGRPPVPLTSLTSSSQAPSPSAHHAPAGAVSIVNVSGNPATTEEPCTDMPQSSSKPAVVQSAPVTVAAAPSITSTTEPCTDDMSQSSSKPAVVHPAPVTVAAAPSITATTEPCTDDMPHSSLKSAVVQPAPVTVAAAPSIVATTEPCTDDMPHSSVNPAVVHSAPASVPVSVSAAASSVAVTTEPCTTDMVASSVAPSRIVTIVQTPSKTTVPESTLVITLRTTLTVSAMQSASAVVPPNTSGTVITSLETAGEPSAPPFNTTVIATPSSSIAPLRTGAGVISASPAIKTTAMATGNIFALPIAIGAPPAQITSRGDHPVPRLGIDRTGPIETNKFYANFFLGTRLSSTWTHPYSLAWAGGQGVTGSWGISVEHVKRAQTVFGPGSPPSYFINPLGLQSFVISARELGAGTSLTESNVAGFSVNINLAPASRATPMIVFPLVQGMGFVTAVYSQGTPILQSSIFFKSMVYLGKVAGSSTTRYSVTLMDGNVWLVYLTPATGSSAPTLTLAGDSQIIGNTLFTGTLQIAKVPITTSLSNAQALYDASVGVYPTSAALTGTASGTSGSYSLTWTKGGLTAKPLLMFALPHHVSSFSSTTRGLMKAGFVLQTTTKGLATAVVADSWTMQENLATSIDFAPWTPTTGSQTRLPPAAVSLINSVAAVELNEDMEAQTDLNSMYYAGKALAKFATIVYTANSLGNATGVASAGLAKLKVQFARFTSNQQIFPLVYDSAWGGIVSSASYTTGDSGADFGNTYYNDHHFHYGYFVYAAAVIGRLDPTWLSTGTNKAWVQSLIRDYANPVTTDGYFPFSRMFDWYHGHSWAHGLYETGDGKDQESSSEDAFSAYAIKMWGKTIGDANMESRGALMLAVQARSFTDYYLLQSDNTIEPPSFVPNKVGGILFENKIDHTTYFGKNPEYIEGIHMLPLNPSSTLTRPKAFVTQEWNTYFSNGRVDAVAGGWRGILYANLAIIDPRTAYNFFAQSGFQNAWLDGGASRTWYLAFCAGLGGAS